MKRGMACLFLTTALVGCQEFHGARETTTFTATPKVVDIARDDIIRIVTPFAEPRVITTSDAEITRSQHVLYVLPSDQQSISMFVTDSENEANSLSLTLHPKTDGVREIDFAATPSAPMIRAASSKGTTPIIRPDEVAAEPEPEEWKGKKCRLCRPDGQSGSDYDDSRSW
jgi:hypothetical protein